MVAMRPVCFVKFRMMRRISNCFRSEALDIQIAAAQADRITRACELTLFKPLLRDSDSAQLSPLRRIFRSRKPNSTKSKKAATR
jgi:hypothetical protein